MLVLSLLASPALACGGFFCDNVSPVEQTGEQIVFAVDDASSTVTVHVRVTYAGPAESFAWVVPVAAIPTLGVSSAGLFDALDRATEPLHILDLEFESCAYESDADTDSDTDSDTDADSDSDADTDGPTVEVVAQAEVGPYETVTLKAETSAGLVTWLQENGFGVPATFDAAIAPYVASGQYVVALKLLKDKSTGDLQPLAMTYPGTVASIPIQLTSVAAAPGMPLEVYVLGESRAVPISYLHVVPNPFVYDWFRASVDWEDTIARAADEAGGHAFATDFAGPTAALQGTVYWGQFDATLASLGGQADVSGWWTAVTGTFSPSAALIEVFRRQIPVPAGVEENALFNCVPCYAMQLEGLPFDAVAATADIEATIVKPLRDAEALLAAYPHLTRLTSSLDAREMTVDPTFELNADMSQDVDRTHLATMTYECAGTTSSAAPRTFTVAPEGWTVALPSTEQLADMGVSDYKYLSSLTTYAALRIEKTAATGQPAVVADQTPWLEEQVALLAPSADPGSGVDGDADTDLAGDPPCCKPDASGCGCATGGAAGWWSGVAVLLALAGRRLSARTGALP